MDFYRVLKETVKTHPQKEALIFGKEQDSFAELFDKTSRLMGAFSKLGMKKGEKLAIYLPGGPQYVYSYLAALSLGITVVPLDLAFKKDEVKNILRHAEVNYLISEKDMELSGVKVIKDIDNLIKCAHPIEGETVNEGELAVLIYTSGTTGSPKAVPFTYKHLDSPVATMGYYGYDKWLLRNICYVPFSHLGGLVYILMTVYFGSTLVLGRRFIPGIFLKELERYKITAVWLPPSILEASLNSKEINQVSLKTLKAIVYFGAPAHPRLLSEIERRFPHIHGVTGYGLTESAAPNVLFPKDMPREKKYKKGILGKPAPWVKVKIVNESGNELPPNQIGEILLKGWFIMPGYYKEPELTREVIKDGWLYTGDLGYLDEEGYLYIAGRKKEVIIVGGLNVYANEVEFVIAEHPKVREVAVVGIENGIRGEAIKAAIVPRDSIEMDAREIITFCRKKLPSYKVPRVIEFRKALPRTPSGKIKKAALTQEL